MGTKVVISKRLVFVNSVSGVATQVLNIAVLLWLYQYLLKRISTEEYALYPVLASLIALLPLLSTVLTGGLARYVVEAYAKGDERRVTQIVSTMSVLLLGAGLLVLAVGLVFAWNVGHVLTVAQAYLWDARIMMMLMVFSFVVRLPLAPFIVGLYVRQKFVLLNMIAVSTQLLRITILLVLLLGVSTKVLWVVVATVSAEVCGLVVTQAISRRLIPALTFRRSEIRWGVAKEITSFGGWSLIGQLSELIRINSDPIILNKLGTALDVTCFHLGSMPFSLIQGLSSVIQQPLMPPLTAMHATESKDRLRSAYLRGGRYGLWGTLFVSIPLMVYSREFIALWVGEKFLAAAMVIILLLASYPIVYGNVMMANIAIATAQVRPLALRAIVVQMINLLLTLYLVGVRGMGAVGSALGTFLAMTLIYPVASITLGLRLADVSLGRWLRETVWPGWLPGLAAATVWILLKVMAKPSTWLSLSGCTACGLVCYIVILLLFCLQENDRNDLKRAMSSLRSYIPSVTDAIVKKFLGAETRRRGR
jgi:O-antigen/teichoic acid export membrane protein